MGRAREHENLSQTCEIVDFDAALLEACSPEARADLIREARLLAGVFAPDGDVGKLVSMAEQLNSGARDVEMDRAHARRLACALKHLASEHSEPGSRS